MAGSYAASPLGMHRCLVGTCFVMEGLAVLCGVLLVFLCTQGVTRRAPSADKERFCVVWMVGGRGRGGWAKRHVTALDFPLVEDFTAIYAENSNLSIHSLLPWPRCILSKRS